MRGIYRILNKVNSKMYVGSTVNFDTRWREHKNGLVAGRHFNPYLQRAWDKYGEENFVFEVVEEVLEKDAVLLACEQWYLDAWFPTGFLYNIATDAQAWMRGRVGVTNPFYGERHTEASKQLMRESQVRYWENNPHPWIGKHHTEESKQKNRESTLAYYENHDHPTKGNPKSEEHKDKLSIATIEWHKTHENSFKGRHHTEESNRKNSESNKEWHRTHEHPMLGKHHSKEAKQKNREAHLGKKPTQVHKDKISRALSGEKHPLYGKPCSEKRKAKISMALAGRKLTREHRSNVSKGLEGHKVLEETRQKIGMANAKPYPAFYNIRTKVYISEGHNLAKMCGGSDLSYSSMLSLKNKGVKQTKEGWKLAGG